MYRKRGSIDASESWFSLESEISELRLQQFQASEVREDIESNKRARDIHPSLENSTGEDNYQCIKGWSRRERRSIHQRAVFNPSRDGERHPCADEL